MTNNIFYELTYPQKIIWNIEQYFKNIPINNICGHLIIKQNVNLELLKSAINIFISNNDSFQLRFKMINGKLVQYLDKFENLDFEIINIQNKSELKLHEEKMVNSVFKFEDSRLFDFKLFKMSSLSGGFIVNVHHIISDAATLAILCTEIMKIYSSLINNKEISYTKFSYLDYIESEKKYKKSERRTKDFEYWKNTLSPLPEAANFFPKKNNSVLNYKAKRKEFLIEPVLFNRITEYCKSNNTSIYNFLLAVYSIYLGRINNSDEFIIGTPILNRTNFAEKNTCGMFINTSILKVHVDSNLSFKSLLENVAKNSINMLKHQKYNYQSILKDVRKKDSNISNLFNILFSYQVTKATDKNIDIPYSIKWSPTQYISNDLQVHFHDNNATGSLDFAYDYRISKIQEKEIIKFHNRIIYIIKQVLSDDKKPISNIQIVLKAEKQKILNTFNTPICNYPKNKTIIELFQEQVRSNPNKKALSFEGKNLSYLDLDIESNKLANYLMQYNFNYEDRIAIFLDKSIEMIISILAILKINCTFLPIDIAYPHDRIEYILKDAESKLIITTSNLRNNLKNKKNVICLDTLNLQAGTEFKYNKVSSSSLAYVMYTSGSTGKPKGVMIEQKSIIRLVINPNYIHFSSKEKILQTGSIVFDACTFEIWSALLNGFTLYILNKSDLLNPTFLGNYLLIHRITILWLTSPLFNQLVDVNPYLFNRVKYLLTGGDVLSTKHINKLMKVNPNIKIINGYGPTENTTFSCCYNIDKKFLNNIPIGYPISGTTCYIVSKDNCIQPIGVPGELLVGGDGLSRGYLNNKRLNNSKFIQNPFEPNSRLYRTGDLVRWNAKGYIEFLGRIDDQVKIRGFRIEPTEINKCILKFPNVKNSATIIQTIQNEKRICSYIIPKGSLNIGELKDFLSTLLPNYMIPSYITIMDSFPITVNGKIAKDMLPIPDISKNNRKIIKPKDAIENMIYDMVKKITSNKHISINDNFFNDIGLDSLDSMRLSNMLYEYNVSFQDISDYPTIKLLAEKIEKKINISHFENLLPQIDIKEKDFQYDLSSVLLTGTLGFLGMHLLKDLCLCDEVKKIYCLVRNKESESFQTRFFNSLHYYFKNTLDDYIFPKVELICGDFANLKLGLSSKKYTQLAKKIKTVVHCGASVKHYGNFQKINSSNVLGTENIIEFCKLSKAKLAHISTISVGGYEAPNEKLELTENTFNIGQTFDNHVYMITKYLAEYHVLSSFNNNEIDAKIFRIGNIMPRFSDNVFQKNIQDNAMINRIKTIIKLGQAALSYKSFTIDFTPVDLCSHAILSILQHPEKQTIYHIYNNNLISFYDFFEKSGYDISYIPDDKFIKELRNLNNPISYNLLSDLQHKNILIPINNNLSTSILKKLNFAWNKIDKKYIQRLMQFM